MNQRPSEEEYAGSSGEYIRLVPDGNIIDILFAQEKQMIELLASLTESQAVRQSTITLLRGLPAEAWTRKGTANNLSITVRALAYGIAGHELHHMGVIRNRYLS
ncbi:DinB family protein [Bacillus thuringiensis]|nr:DinB family protein [Bacillus cereus]MDA2605433.1 DinB family protein [Bacillus cereus]